MFESSSYFKILILTSRCRPCLWVVLKGIMGNVGAHPEPLTQMLKCSPVRTTVTERITVQMPQNTSTEHVAFEALEAKNKGRPAVLIRCFGLKLASKNKMKCPDLALFSYQIREFR